MMDERIVAAAIRFNGEPVFLPRPKRHHDIIGMLGQSNPWPITGEQGFMTSKGRFVCRREAWIIAVEAEQAPRQTTCPGRLFSEDLW
jgi:hypothetical protein